MARMKTLAQEMADENVKGFGASSLETLENILKMSQRELEVASDCLDDALRELNYIRHSLGEKC